MKTRMVKVVSLLLAGAFVFAAAYTQNGKSAATGDVAVGARSVTA